MQTCCYPHSAVAVVLITCHVVQDLAQDIINMFTNNGKTAKHKEGM